MFVTKLNSAGSSLVYSTFLGGSEGEFGNGIAIDTSGNAYITGITEMEQSITRPHPERMTRHIMENVMRS